MKKESFQKCYSHHQVLMKVLSEYFDPNEPIVGIELGTYCGDSARSILWALPNAKLYTVDPWTHRDGSQFEAGEPQLFHDKNKELAYSRLVCPDFGDRVEILEMTSEKAYETLKARGITEVDFVWIDGNHEGNAVIQDLDMFEPMVKSGGILGGHDYGQIHPLTEIIMGRYHQRLWSGFDFAWWVYVER